MCKLSSYNDTRKQTVEGVCTYMYTYSPTQYHTLNYKVYRHNGNGNATHTYNHIRR